MTCLRATLNYKKKAQTFANALRLTTSQIHNSYVCTCVVQTQLCIYLFARFFSEVVIRERLSKYFQMYCIWHAQILCKCSASG